MDPYARAHQWVLDNYPEAKDKEFDLQLFEAIKMIQQEDKEAEWRKTLPVDYEACGDCGFDHGYEYEQAHAWHTKNPGSYNEG